LAAVLKSAKYTIYALVLYYTRGGPSINEEKKPWVLGGGGEPGAIYRPCRQHVRIAPEHTRVLTANIPKSRRFVRIYIYTICIILNVIFYYYIHKRRTTFGIYLLLLRHIGEALISLMDAPATSDLNPGRQLTRDKHRAD